MSAGEGGEVPDRSDEKREGWVPSGRRGWRKVGGDRRGVEVQWVTPAWARALREQAAKGKADERAVILGQDWYHHLKRLEARKRTASTEAEQTKEQRKENQDD